MVISYRVLSRSNFSVRLTGFLQIPFTTIKTKQGNSHCAHHHHTQTQSLQNQKNTFSVLAGIPQPSQYTKSQQASFVCLLVTDPAFGAYGSFPLWSFSTWDWELWWQSLLAWSSSLCPGEETEGLTHAGGTPCNHAQKADWVGGHSPCSIWESSSPADATSTTCPIHHQTPVDVWWGQLEAEVGWTATCRRHTGKTWASSAKLRNC